MGKKNRRKNRELKVYTSSYEDRVFKALSVLTHKELQKECIKRGMPFELVFKSHQHLVSWMYKDENFDRGQDLTKLIEFDSFVENEIEKRGYKKGDTLLSPCLRFSYTKGIENLNNPKELKPAKEVPEKKKKPKAEVDETTGVRKGTKKAMTFDLALKNVDLATTIAKVTAEFKDAQPKSIKIWYKRALKTQKA